MELTKLLRRGGRVGGVGKSILVISFPLYCFEIYSTT